MGLNAHEHLSLRSLISLHRQAALKPSARILGPSIAKLHAKRADQLQLLLDTRTLACASDARSALAKGFLDYGS